MKLFSQPMDLCLRRQVCEEQDGLAAGGILRDFRAHEVAPGPIAANHNHLRALFRKQQSSRQPEAACCSRDEDGLPAHRYPVYL
jgi:hypothetical protein